MKTLVVFRSRNLKSRLAVQNFKMALKNFHHTSNAIHFVMSLFASFACNADVLNISNGLHVGNCWSCMDVFAALLNAVASFLIDFEKRTHSLKTFIYWHSSMKKCDPNRFI